MASQFALAKQFLLYFFYELRYLIPGSRPATFDDCSGHPECSAEGRPIRVDCRADEKQNLILNDELIPLSECLWVDVVAPARDESDSIGAQLLPVRFDRRINMPQTWGKGVTSQQTMLVVMVDWIVEKGERS